MPMYQKDLDIHRRWQQVLDRIDSTFGKRPNDIKNVLFLIGIHELGKGKKHFSREEKQDLIRSYYYLKMYILISLRIPGLQLCLIINGLG